MSDFIKGDAVILYIWNGIGAYEPIACLTSNSLSFTRGVIEAQTKCDPGQIKKAPGSVSYEVPFEAFYIKTGSGKTNFDEMMAFINTSTGTTQDWRMSTDQTSPEYYYGTAVLSDLEMTSPSGDEYATFSGTLAGSGLVTTTDPHA